MTDKDKAEPIPAGASPGYQIKERFPTPEKLPTVPEAGALTPQQRFDRVLLSFTRIARGMANTAPSRGDAMGPQWHELACDLEAHCKEAGLDKVVKVATSDRPIELRDLVRDPVHNPVPVSTMLHTPSGMDPLQLQVLDSLRAQGEQMRAQGDLLARLMVKLDR